MSVLKEAISRLDDESMTVTVREEGPHKDAFFMSEGFACQVPFEGPDVEAYSGNRDYDTLVRAHESGNLREVDFDELDREDLNEQLEASREAFSRDELDLENLMQDDGIDFGERYQESSRADYEELDPDFDMLR
ncbi:MAG: hypothetical protein OSB62_04615 [Alphaproteobacteria bacterium]|nr:hypothetical protein [Alphaproteobacteria bacterium]